MNSQSSNRRNTIQINIKGIKFVVCFDQIMDHWLTHIAKTNKTNCTGALQEKFKQITV